MFLSEPHSPLSSCYQAPGLVCQGLPKEAETEIIWGTGKGRTYFPTVLQLTLEQQLMAPLDSTWGSAMNMPVCPSIPPHAICCCAPQYSLFT